MALVVDLTKGETTTFYGSSAEDVNYATNFWQSIQLHPPMESRLVSSDIKQRLKVAPPSSQSKRTFLAFTNIFTLILVVPFCKHACYW
jgi:hypothetical protein